MNLDFSKRSLELERIDTGDYTPEEYDTFLREIKTINRLIGDARALKKSMLTDISKSGTNKSAILDVGAGSGELLRGAAEFFRNRNIEGSLVGLDLNEKAVLSIKKEANQYSEIMPIRGDAFLLPFADKTFDYSVSSLFTHHFTDNRIVEILKEMSRVSRRGIYIIDLHRHPVAYRLYRIYCRLFRISKLVTDDGSLSILRSFIPAELTEIAEKAGLREIRVETVIPFRIILRAK